VDVTAEISAPDEDGYCTVTIYIDGERYEGHSIRCDQANQWAAQEVACIQEYA